MRRAVLQRRRTAPGLALPGILGAVVLALVLSACGEKQPVSPPSVNTLPTASANPAAAPVVVTGLPDGIKVQVGDGDPANSPGGGLTFVSPVYSLGPSGPLNATAKVTMELDHALPDSTPLVVGSRESASAPWQWLPATLTSDHKHATFTTTHFSDFGVLSIDISGVLASFEDKVQTQLTSSVDKSVAKPTCDNGKEARQDGYTVRSWPRKTLGWCFGLDNDKRVLKVVNRTHVPVQVAHGTAAATTTASKVSGVWTSWLGILAPGSKDTFLAPGGSATYDAELQPKQTLILSAETDAVAQSLRALYAGVSGLAGQVQGYGLKAPDAAQVFQGLVARPVCAAALGKGSAAMISGCLSGQRLQRMFGDNGQLLSPLLSSPSLQKFWAGRFKFLAEQDQKVDTQRIAVTRAAPDFGDLVGTFTGHTRVLKVSKTGLVTEKLNAGVTRVIELTYQLSDPQVTGRTSGQKTGGTTTAKAVITKVVIFDRQAIGGNPPKVGDTGNISLSNGIVTPPYLQTTYCDRSAARKGKCGA